MTERPCLVVCALVTLGALISAGCGGSDNASLVDTIAPTTTAATTSAPPTTTQATTTSVPPTTTAAPTTTVRSGSGSGSSGSGTGSPRAAQPLQPPLFPPYEAQPGVSGVSALTNLAVDDAVAASPVLAVKIDNTPRARPQFRIEQADVLFEENVEGITRFIAMFHSRSPDSIGPVRSARTSDLPILSSANRPILAWSGGNNYVTKAIGNAGKAGLLVDGGSGALGSCYKRVRGRSAPHNLVVDVSCVRSRAKNAGAARPLWTFSETVPAGDPSTSFTVVMTGVKVGWTLDPNGRYLRTQNGSPHKAATGEQLGFTNVVVMSVGYAPSPADKRSPEAQTVGSGPVVVHRNGVAVKGTWTRAASTDAFSFTDSSGAPIPLAPGSTAVELTKR
jgi:hypothetical protein